MSVTPLHSWPTRSAVLAATKKERKIPQMKGKKRKYSQTTGTKSMVTPVFATLIFD